MEKGRSRTPLWEKIVGMTGLALICFTVSFLLFSALNDERAPPDISFQIVSSQAVGQGFLVLVEVSNTGEQTAAELSIEARSNRRDGGTESAGLVLDYLAAGSARRLGFYFATDPGEGELLFRALSYQEP